MVTRKFVLMNLFAGQQWRLRQREQTCRHGVVGEAEGGTNVESSMGTYRLPCVKYIASRNLLCDRGSSTQCSVTTCRGGMGWEAGGMFKVGGTCVYLWLIHVDVWQKPAQPSKAIIHQLKIDE